MKVVENSPQKARNCTIFKIFLGGHAPKPPWQRLAASPLRHAASHGARNYEIRNPRLQPPVHIHEYITGTCRYQLTVLLNEINSIVEPLDPLKSVVNNVQNVTLLGLKRTIKSYLLQKYSYYCVIPNCYVCQHYVV